jgi:hypothetical protein
MALAYSSDRERASGHKKSAHRRAGASLIEETG